MPIDLITMVPGRTYWIAYRSITDDTDVESAPFICDAIVDSWGKHQFTPDDGGPKIYLFPDEITSIADVDDWHGDTVRCTAADVAKMLDDTSGLTVSRLWPGYDRSEGIYTADLPLPHHQVGVFTYPPGDTAQLDVAAVTLSVLGLNVSRSVHLDAGEYVVTWPEGEF
jgi:hypothetical protein